MEMSVKAWLEYAVQRSNISQRAIDMMQAWLDKNPEASHYDTLNHAYNLVMRYGQATGALSCKMYEATAEAQGAAIATAEMADLPNYDEVGKAVNGTMKQSKSVADTVGRLIKQVGEDTILKNAGRDEAEFAWVPSGDSCAFCITLASRGWQHMSKAARNGNHAEHIHANCDCTYAVRFDGKSTVAGYDPDKYLAQYNSAKGNSSQAKINALRRENYARNKDSINARKRELYAEQKKHRKEEENEKQMLQLAKQGNTFVVKADKLYDYSKNIKPIEGYEDIVSHGDQYSLVFEDGSGFETNVSAKEFCDIIEQAGVYEGGNIRLIACQTGAGDGIVPTYIAKRFNIEVLAPTEIVNVDFEGNMILADNIEDAKIGIETGDWVLFNAEGRVK